MIYRNDMPIISSNLNILKVLLETSKSLIQITIKENLKPMDLPEIIESQLNFCIGNLKYTIKSLMDDIPIHK